MFTHTLKYGFASLVVAAAMSPALAAGPAAQTAGVAPKVIFRPSGGALTSMQLVIENEPQQTPSTTFIDLPGATRSVTLGPGKTALLVIDFSAECRLFPNTSGDNWVEVRAMVNGLPAQPNDPVSPVALCSDDRWAAQATSWARRVTGAAETGTTFRVRIQYKVHDNAGTGGLNAWVDDYVLKVGTYE